MQAALSLRDSATAASFHSPEEVGLPCNRTSHLLPPVHSCCACCPDLAQAAGTTHSSLLLLVFLLQQLPLQRLQA
jgi:hypothetical protein